MLTKHTTHSQEFASRHLASAVYLTVFNCRRLATYITYPESQESFSPDLVAPAQLDLTAMNV